MAYRANVGGMFGSGINQKPQTGVSIDVAPLAGVIAQALAAKRDGLIHKAMLQREFDRQDAADKIAAEERDYQHQQADATRQLLTIRQAMAAKQAEDRTAHQGRVLTETERHNKAMEAAALARARGSAKLHDPRNKPVPKTSEAVGQDTAYSAVVAADGNVDKAIQLLNRNPTDAAKTYGMTRRQFEDAAKRYRLHLKQSHRSVEDVQQTPGAEVSPATDGGGDITLPETGAVDPSWIEHARQNPDYAAYLKANGVVI